MTTIPNKTAPMTTAPTTARRSAFIFYDTETTGLSPCHDQILQFAAIVTDGDFNVLKTCALRCRRSQHIVPSPTAMLLTGITADQLEKAPLSSLEMMQQVAGLLQEHTPATVIGHNTLRFDEDFLRHGLFAHLLPPYLSQLNGNRRADTLRMLQMCAVHQPGAITWPVNAEGQISMKLGEVVRANGISFAESAAHDALNDVHATIALAKLIRDKAPGIFLGALRMARKSYVLDFIARHPVFCRSTRFGKPATAIVTAIAPHPDNRNEIALFDLSHDPAAWLNRSVADILASFNETPRVITSLRANAMPMLATLSGASPVLPAERPDDFTLGARAAAIASNQAFQERVQDAMRLRYDDHEPSTYIEEQLYAGGFPSDADRRLCQAYQHASPEERIGIVERLSDPRLRTHAQRLNFFTRPDLLDPDARIVMQDWLRQRLLTCDEVPWLTLPKAMLEVGALRDASLNDKSLSETARAAKVRRLIAIELHLLTLASQLPQGG